MSFFKNPIGEFFIAVPDSEKEQLIYKWPNDNIEKLTSIIVDADEMALFLQRGEVKGTFTPGRYKLDAQEWPWLGNLIDEVTGGNAYRAELFFVSTRQFAGQKFGGSVDNVKEPVSNLIVSLKMHGEYSLHITDPQKFVLQLIGTGNTQGDENVYLWVEQQMLKTLRAHITQNVVAGKWPVLGISSFLPDLEAGGLPLVNESIAQYGIEVTNFGNIQVGLSEEDASTLKNLSKDVAYSQLAGSFGAYAVGEAMIGAGQGEAKGGQGGNSTILAAGLGIGNAMAGAIASNPSTPVAPSTPMQNAQKYCIKCNANIPVNSKFCPSCGAAQSENCSQCGTILINNPKFCPNCGTKI